LFASGSWYGEVSLSDNVIPVDSSLTATTNAHYIPSDPAIQQELNEGKATISYEYVWTFSPGGQIENGQGTSLCKGKFTTVSSTLNDKTVSVNVTAEVIYLEDSLVVDSDSHNFYANLTVFRPNIVVGELGEDTEEEPGAYIPKGGNKTCSLQLEGFLPDETTITLSCNNPGKVSLWDGETKKTFPYGCSVSALPKNLMLKGENTSDKIKDITLTLTTSKGGSDSAVATVFSVNLSANSSTVCAGGDDLDICRTNVHISTTPVISGLPVSLSLINKVTDSADGTKYENVATLPGSANLTNLVTDATGSETVLYTSGMDASNNPDTGLLLDIGIKAICDSTEMDTQWIRITPPDETLAAFLDPEAEEPKPKLEFLWADGESQALNRYIVKYNSTPIPGHVISWKFKFWTLQTLNEAALEMTQNEEEPRFFDELTEEELDYLLDNCEPDYDGTGPSDYGQIESSSETDSNGIAESTYTAGFEAGLLEIIAENNNIYRAARAE
ncbi:MAG: hypothetical protein GX796_06520, partial [Clostridiaceae bacterium]|nr:hypothetical protein [Clostridiaceae bacterium]